MKTPATGPDGTSRPKSSKHVVGSPTHATKRSPARVTPRSPTLSELAAAQGVGPTDLGKILGTWPGEMDDGFEAMIDELRGRGRRDG